jgi:hypothetical protein
VHRDGEVAGSWQGRRKVEVLPVIVIGVVEFGRVLSSDIEILIRS